MDNPTVRTDLAKCLLIGINKNLSVTITAYLAAALWRKKSLEKAPLGYYNLILLWVAVSISKGAARHILSVADAGPLSRCRRDCDRRVINRYLRGIKGRHRLCDGANFGKSECGSRRRMIRNKLR
ncbi:hypothetical protein GWI33_016517 [Rhynchophorus ferrugineus]|uniref:Uncharacterized protein n=1 Tax=Rhynchophorus ferrugineus TaxID=354439 RepID=A0A834HX74_RHYFE|nr:hypothetical protein GWI33_016517 [Rhynchophorus ferrugineus]